MIPLNGRRHIHPPGGWHRSFIDHFFGVTKGIYTILPGSIINAYSCLSFLGFTFVPLASETHEDGSFDWSINFKTPGKDQSWTEPEPVDEDKESEDLNVALIKTNVSQNTKSKSREERESKDRKKRSSRRHSHGPGIKPTEVVEPDASPTRNSRHKDNIRVERYPERNEERSSAKRRIRSPTPPLPSMGAGGIPGRRGRQYVMEARNVYDPPDATVFDEPDSLPGFSPFRAEHPHSFKSPSSKRRQSSSSSSSQVDKLPRAPSPPPPRDLDSPPQTPPRRLRRTSTEPITPTPGSRRRALSPTSSTTSWNTSYTPSSPTRSDTSFTSSSSYFQTPPPNPSWTGGYPSPPPFPIPPLSPTNSSSFPSSASSISTSSDFSTYSTEFTENHHFVVTRIISVSDTPSGRFYKVQWGDTWETKQSVNQQMDSKKYRVQETLEWRYVDGIKYFNVRWRNTWERAHDIEGIVSDGLLQEFWDEMEKGGKERVHVNRRNYA